jgi:hypothetical protein
MKNEILTPEEFITRIKIGRSTMFDWIAKDILVCGKHYFKQGRILRFVWNDEMILSLLEASAKKPADTPPTLVTQRSQKATAKQSINWDY